MSTIENLENEVWVPIKDYEGLYEFSNFKRVKNLKRNKILSENSRLVYLCKNGEITYKSTSRLFNDYFYKDEIKDLPNEVWVYVKGYRNKYMISNFGRLKNMNFRNINLKKIITPYNNKFGYLVVCLTLDSKETLHSIHSLVLNSFTQKPHCDLNINHIDGVKHNNYLNNLEWTTSRENSCHRSLSMVKASKYTGVTFDKKGMKWISSIRIKTKRIHIGRFNTEEQAYAARVNKEKELGIINKYL